MPLDSRYVIAPSLQEYFVDKDSGLPMSGGQVFFYHDTARSILKDVYELSGSPPNYTYTVLPNPVTLSAVGTFQDASGNDIIPYYFPFVSLTDDTVDLYYIEVYNSDGVLQFTREGWPNVSGSGSSTGQDITNFVPNGQFLLHDNIPASSSNSFVVNQVSQDITTIAQGGWTFERGPSSTATDFITFPRYGSAITSPTGNPRYACQIQTTIEGSDTRKDLCLTFPDVNKFASNTEYYNFYFEGQSQTGSAINNVQIIVRKFFGTGGSPSATTETVVTSISLAAGSITKYNTPILFGTNENKSIGTNNDDYVQIVLRFPPTGIQTALVTDFCLTFNLGKLSEFPTQTNAEQLDESTAGWFPTPDPNGFDLYLPAVLTPSGLTFSDADIGKIYAAMYETLPIGELDCDGSQYLTENYSMDKIPYARLQAKWFDSTNLNNYFGNGSDYMTANFTNLSLTSTSFRLNITSPGAGTIADVNTGFTFTPITTGVQTGETAYTEGGITVIDNVIGLRTPATGGTSGFAVTTLRNSTLNYYTFSVVPSTPVTAGTYFTFVSSLGSFYVWFTVDGAGSDPAPGGTGIKVAILSTYVVNEVARCIKDAMNGFQSSSVFPVIGSSVVPGSYFTVTIPSPSSKTFYVWYTKDGMGTDPQPTMRQSLKVKVNILSTDSIVNVVTKSISAINMKYFATPDLRGQFLRGWDAGAGVDLDSALRFTQNNSFLTNQLGSFELDQFFSHLHASGTLSGTVQTTDTGSTPSSAHVAAILFAPDSTQPVTITGSTALTGGAETAPVNCAVRWIVKY
jgi:hypothetical protein